MSTNQPVPRRQGASFSMVVIMLLLGIIIGGGAYLGQQHRLPWQQMPAPPAPDTTVSAPKPAPAPPADLTVDKATGWTYDEVVKRGLEAYLAQYEKKTGDNSSLGQDNAAVSYEKIKAANNDARAQALSAAERQQLAETRKVLEAWTDATCELGEDLAGGGNMFGHMNASDGATREDELGTMIDRLLSTANAAGRGKADAAMRETAKHLKTLAGLKKSDLSDDFWWKEYNGDYAKLKKLVPQLEALVASLPDSVADIVAEDARGSLSVAMMPVEGP